MLNAWFQSRRLCHTVLLLGLFGIGPISVGLAADGAPAAPVSNTTPAASPSDPTVPTPVPTVPGPAPEDEPTPDQSQEEESIPPLSETPELNQPPSAQQEEEPPTPLAKLANPSIRLRGLVWRAKPGIVFLRTPIGLLSLSSRSTLKSLPGSQEVAFWIHENHVTVDLVKRADRTLVHRYLTGPFKRDNLDGKKLVRWTPEGEKAFHMGPFERTLAAHREGDSVTVEVDSAGNVIGVHDLQFDLQIGQVPTVGSDALVLLTGTISKLKSNFIFFRTPIGIINVNAKIGIKNAKVGQTMTLHMHDHHLVADLSAANGTTPAHRFLTGPLEFTDSDRSSIRLWTPDGEQTYPADRGKSALAGVKAGSSITLELNGQGDVVEFHRIK